MVDEKEYFEINKRIKNLEELGVLSLLGILLGLILSGLGLFYLIKGNLNWVLFIFVIVGFLITIFSFIFLRKNLRESKTLIKKLEDFDIIKKLGT